MGAKLISLKPFSSSGFSALCIRVTSGSTDLRATSASKVLPYPSLMLSPQCSAANDRVAEANTTGATAAAPSSPAKAIAPSRRSPEPRCIPLQGVINQPQEFVGSGSAASEFGRTVVFCLLYPLHEGLDMWCSDFRLGNHDVVSCILASLRRSQRYKSACPQFLFYKIRWQYSHTIENSRVRDPAGGVTR